MKKIFSLVAASLFAASMWAAVGPQSVAVAFLGEDAEGWVVSSGGAITAVANGVANVQMALQTNTKYRADFQYNTAEMFSMDKTKDVVWAIKLTAALPGSANSRKFEINYQNAEGTGSWINGINGPSGSIDCEDGGKIYYFDLAALNKLDALQDGEIEINQIHFIFADAVIDSEADAHYSVDWIASFETVNDLKSFKDWNDEATDISKPYHELLFRPKADASGYDKRGNGFRATDVEFEGNYKAGLFAIEYFLIKDLAAQKNYKLVLNSTGSNHSPLAIWDFPYQVNYEETAADIITKATAVVGLAPRAESGEMLAPIDSVNCIDGAWTFAIPGAQLTPLAVHADYTLVGLLVTSKCLTDSNSKGKFASSANTTVAAPSLTVVEDDDPTAINNVTNEAKAVKRIMDGRIVIIRDNKMFDLTGRHL